MSATIFTASSSNPLKRPAEEVTLSSMSKRFKSDPLNGDPLTKDQFAPIFPRDIWSLVFDYIAQIPTYFGSRLTDLAIHDYTILSQVSDGIHLYVSYHYCLKASDFFHNYLSSLRKAKETAVGDLKDVLLQTEELIDGCANMCVPSCFKNVKEKMSDTSNQRDSEQVNLVREDREKTILSFHQIPKPNQLSVFQEKILIQWNIDTRNKALTFINHLKNSQLNIRINHAITLLLINFTYPELLTVETIFKIVSQNHKLLKELNNLTPLLLKTDQNWIDVFYLAITKGNTDVVQLFATNKCLLESEDLEGNTPLLHAAESGNRVICEILLKAGANLQATNSSGQNVLHLAIGNIELVQLFASNECLRELKVDEDEGNTPLLLAACYGHRADCEILLKAGANLQATNKNGQNVLHIAAARGYVDLVQRFAMDERLLESKDKNGNTPLLLAAQCDHSAGCEILLKAGANRQATDLNGRNALHLAAAKGNTDAVQLFASYKGLLESKDKDGRTPLLLAPNSKSGRSAAWDILLEAGANPLAVDSNKRNVLHLAAQQNNIDAVKRFATDKRLLESKDKDGFTPLLLAYYFNPVYFNNEKSGCEILLEAGANLQATNSSGQNVLHLAIQNDYNAYSGNNDNTYLGAVKRFATDKRLLESKDKDGFTPLLLAANFGDKYICELLIGAGANIKVTNRDGKRPLDLAKEKGHLEVVELFTKHLQPSTTASSSK